MQHVAKFIARWLTCSGDPRARSTPARWLGTPVLAAILILCGLSPNSATGATDDIELRWAGAVLPSGTPPDAPEAAVGPPDNVITGFSTPDAEATYAQFTAGQIFNLQAFATFLGVSPILLQADFVATDRQGVGGSGPFEASLWTFTSDSGTKVESVSVPSDVQVVAARDVAAQAYASFFGITNSDLYSFVLIDLQVVNPLAPDFRVRINRRPGNTGAPDPDWMAVIHHLPAIEVPGCAGDLDRDGEVTVDEIIRAVNTVLNGCTGCANISGVWVLKHFVGGGDPCGGAPGTYEFETTINQGDDCTFDGTFKDQAGNLTIIRNGRVSNQAVSFERVLASVGQQLHEGMVLSDGRTMGGTGELNPGCQYDWNATRRVEGTSAAQ